MQSSVGQQNIQQQPIKPQVQAAPQQHVQNNTAKAVQTSVPQQTTMTQPTQQYMSAQPQYQTSPINSQQPQCQNVQVPNYSGVNIQIFNPSVTPPGSTAPVYNVNAPNYGNTPVSGCYPSNYYTNDWGNGTHNGQNINNNNGANGVNGANGANSTNANNTTNSTNTTNTTENKTTNKKTEKREVVQLTDDYIRNLENYLNSQDKEVRLMGAKEVIARLEEDHSRKDDKALNALVNKMLQDPSTPVKILALSALDAGVVSGDDYTVGLLKQMQNSTSGYGQDAMQATNILLKMSGKKVEKEVEVKDNKNKQTQTTSNSTKTANTTENKAETADNNNATTTATK